jgi:hypothetical protein
MKRGHMPMRTCKVCRRRAPKQELQRWVVEEGCLVADERQLAVGYGVYCCREESCRERLGKKLGKKNKKIAPAAL